MLVDSRMPGLNGADLIRAIRAERLSPGMRILIMDRFGQQRIDVSGLGVAGVITKPVRARVLRARLTGRSYSSEYDSTGDGQTSPQSAQPRILIAEDNPVNQKVARHLVEKFGYQAEVVSNGKEALAAMARSPFALVLMDCQMPGMDGFEATAEIRQRERDGVRTPVIAMTAHSMNGDRERCIEAGMDDYLSKPVNSDELSVVLERWLPGHSGAINSCSPTPAGTAG
jgi:CheY-like chemotaxis protein